jgi:hypothetical protein
MHAQENERRQEQAISTCVTQNAEEVNDNWLERWCWHSRRTRIVGGDVLPQTLLGCTAVAWWLDIGLSNSVAGHIDMGT